MADLQDQAIRQHCNALRMPTIGGQFARLADAAIHEGQTHVGYLEALLAAEMEERESRAIARLLHEAWLRKALIARLTDRAHIITTGTGRLGGLESLSDPLTLDELAGTIQERPGLLHTGRQRPAGRRITDVLSQPRPRHWSNPPAMDSARIGSKINLNSQTLGVP